MRTGFLGAEPALLSGTRQQARFVKQAFTVSPDGRKRKQ
jgi:hypothetical protein